MAHGTSLGNGRRFLVPFWSERITINYEMPECYKGAASCNAQMSGDFPTLLPGQNAISWTGNVTKVVIQPNWRYLA